MSKWKRQRTSRLVEWATAENIEFLGERPTSCSKIFVIACNYYSNKIYPWKYKYYSDHSSFTVVLRQLISPELVHVVRHVWDYVTQSQDSIRFCFQNIRHSHTSRSLGVFRVKPGDSCTSMHLQLYPSTTGPPYLTAAQKFRPTIKKIIRCVFWIWRGVFIRELPHSPLYSQARLQ